VWYPQIPENSLRHSQCLTADAIKAKGMDDIACPVVNEVMALEVFLYVLLAGPSTGASRGPSDRMANISGGWHNRSELPRASV
jgi:hypothetical protein